MNWRAEANRIAADARGRHAETLAAAWLEGQGWQILARRVKTPRGEVDLVARDGDCLVFVEVKWRATVVALADAIDERRLSRVAAAAELLAPRYAGDMDPFRIDVILLAPGHDPQHIANAWMPF